MRHAALLLLTSVFLFGEFAFGSQAVAAETVCENTEKEAADSPGSLYALSAVLMDGESGRILYEKDGETPRPNASTTKVMTCILALENGAGDDYVMVSDKAAAQPDVQLGMREGEQYYLEDLSVFSYADEPQRYSGSHSGTYRGKHGRLCRDDE